MKVTRGLSAPCCSPLKTSRLSSSSARFCAASLVEVRPTTHLVRLGVLGVGVGLWNTGRGRALAQGRGGGRVGPTTHLMRVGLSGVGVGVGVG